jgi:hypothetical protein
VEDPLVSKLFYSEDGGVVATQCEELATYRRARKVLLLPETRSTATLYLMARCYPENGLPLRVSVNGAEVPGVLPPTQRDAFSGGIDHYWWHTIPIDASLLAHGENVFELWTDGNALNTWSLAMENGHAHPHSYISTDGGETWRNERMGYLNTSRGEYVLRVRLAEGADPSPPAMIWEDAAAPRLQRLRNLVPDAALESGSTLSRVRALATWVSTRWEYRESVAAPQYSPWDPETIIAWGEAGRGHHGQLPNVSCIHYGVVMVCCCLAVGIPARCGIFTGGLNGFNGHFTAEVWFKEWEKWVMVDANVDAIAFKGGVPLSVSEIQELGTDVAELFEWGPGYEVQSQHPVMGPWIPKYLLNGFCFRHRSFWLRNDFLSHPEFTPPGHGTVAYADTTKLVWQATDLENGFGMFPYFGDQNYFDAPPLLD